MNTPTFCSTDLAQLERQLDRWRGRQSGRVRLPGPLWEAAAQLARERSVSEVARRLRIDISCSGGCGILRSRSVLPNH